MAWKVWKPNLWQLVEGGRGSPVEAITYDAESSKFWKWWRGGATKQGREARRKASSHHASTAPFLKLHLKHKIKIKKLREKRITSLLGSFWENGWLQRTQPALYFTIILLKHLEGVSPAKQCQLWGVSSRRRSTAGIHPPGGLRKEKNLCTLCTIIFDSLPVRCGKTGKIWRWNRVTTNTFIWGTQNINKNQINKKQEEKSNW